MKVIDINRTLTSKSEHMGERYLIVDGEITDNWLQFFQAAEKRYFSTMKRAIGTDGKHIIVNCPLDELQDQIDVINKYCSSADQGLSAWKNEQVRKQQEELKKAQEMSDKANKKFDKLKF